MVTVPGSHGQGWAVLALHDVDEVPRDDIARDLSRWLPDGVFFLIDPPHEPTHPLRGYVFVMAGHPDAALLRLERSHYVASVLRQPSGIRRARAVERITDLDLKRMVKKVETKRLTAGGAVEILTGDWRGLRALVLRVTGGIAMVELNLWSRQVQLEMQVQDLRPVAS